MDNLSESLQRVTLSVIIFSLLLLVGCGLLDPGEGGGGGEENGGGERAYVAAVEGKDSGI